MEALLAFLSTVAGKAVAGTAIAAASVGGLHAADVVDVPLLPSESQTDVVTELPADGTEVSNEASDGEAGTETEEESDTDEGRQDADVRQDGEERQDGESQGIGESVSGDAQDGGVEGEDVVAQTPAATKVPAEAFGPEEPGTQAPEQSQAPADAGTQADAEPGTQADDAGSDADAEPGTQAGDNRPASAGAEANGRP